MIFKMKSKTQEKVVRILDKLERKHRSKIEKILKSITMDNGCEFINHKLIKKLLYSKSTRTTAYYVHSYSSCERGSNENANKIICRFISKVSNISNYKKQKYKE